jgi:hypothetical protein
MYTYLTRCVESDEDLAEELDDGVIDETVERSAEVSFGAFWERVCHEDLEQLFPQYDWHNACRDRGVKIWEDFGFVFGKGRYRGVRCYYVERSSIEWVFIESESDYELTEGYLRNKAWAWDDHGK